MVMVYRSGQMVLAMKGNGFAIKLMEMESSGMLMEISLMDSGRRIKPMVMVSTHM